MQNHPTRSGPALPDQRSAGALMLVAAIASIVFVAIDPVAGGDDARAILQSMTANAPMHRIVHAVEMACLFGLAFGMASLAARLGAQRPVVRAGAMAYLAGSLAMLGAAVVDGFVTVDAASYFLRDGHSVETGREVVHMCYAVIQDLAMVSWFLQSIGVLALASALVRERGARRVGGVVGLVTGALPPIAILASYPRMDTAVVVGILLVQLAWNLVVAGLLLRRDDGAAASADGRARMPVPAGAVGSGPQAAL